MNTKSEKQFIVASNCLQFDCTDDCCKYGVNVLPQEHTGLISENLASPQDFTGPQVDDEGHLVYRTRLGPRGCVFFLRKRGCRLHYTGHKPAMCHGFPRTLDEALIAYESGDLPCFGLLKGDEG